MDGVQHDLDRYTGDLDYYNAHYAELLEQHPERWVAIYEGQIIGVEEEIETLVRRLRERGYDPGRVFCEYLTKHPSEFILGGLLLV